MNERKLILFQNLMQLYLKEGKPVGSSHLAEVSKLGVSSATIRNAMADLEKMGLLTSPHTSAGRIPTEQGLRFFVDTILHLESQPPFSPQVAQAVSQRLSNAAGQDTTLAQAAEVLSGLSGLAGVVMLPDKAKERFKHIEFVPLNENRVLVVLVFNDRDIQNRVIELQTPISASELVQIANFLNQHYAGQTLVEVKQALQSEMVEMQQRMNEAMRQMMLATDSVLDAQLAQNQPLVMAGKTKLLNYQELADAEKLKSLFSAFEERASILALLDKSLQAKGLQIFIGSECGSEVYQDCSIVTSPYEVEGEVVGVLGVVGPARMPYEKVAAQVAVTANVVSQMLKQGG
jgi:heat-inducible transcriptional repressor